MMGINAPQEILVGDDAAITALVVVDVFSNDIFGDILLRLVTPAISMV